MLYYHPALMPDEQQMRLFAVYNPTYFHSFVDHEAAIQLRLIDLIVASELGAAIQHQIRELGIDAPVWEDPHFLASQIWHCDALRAVLHSLYQRWQEIDVIDPADMPSGGLAGARISITEQLAVMEETTLDTWLQALLSFHA